MFDPTKPVRTREGLKARVICHDRNHVDGPIVALVTLPADYRYAEREAVHFYYEGGLYATPPGRVFREHDLDLINI